MNEKYKNLEKYSINLNEEVKKNKIDPIIGRDEEIKNVIRILSRKTKNNPILIGNPGVGKTAIAQGIAMKIVNKDIPNHLQNKTVYSLDLGEVVAGAKFQGEFEERLKSIMNEVKENQDEIILFIDEIHMIIGAGKTSGAMDAANLLKPMLARGELSCIGATTLEEYKLHIEQDAAFERRFQKVIVSEPTKEASINILRGLKENFEVYHGVKIEDEAIIAAVNASSRYINDRFLPDKAIDLLDEAAANINVQLASEPDKLENLNRKITSLEIEKKALKTSNSQKDVLEEVSSELQKVKKEAKEYQKEWDYQKDIMLEQKKLKKKLLEKNQEFESAKQKLEYEKAAKLEYQEIPLLKEKIKELSNKLKGYKILNDIVTPKEIYIIISRLTGIPVENLQIEDKEKLLNLESKLNEQVIGQENAAYELAGSIIRNRVNISDPNKPIGTFLFLGPTGVGKTEISKSLSYELFNDKQKMFRLDMSEFMEKHSVSKIVGAPPGYIGYESGSSLCEYVRTNPYSIILFDEIEKAHVDVLNILLQILDEGHLTDNKGRKVNFKNTIVIMTSNIASELIIDNPNISMEELEHILKGYLRPEFINRIDEVIKFNPINEELYKKISKKLLNEFKYRLENINVELEYSQDLIEHIYKNSYTKEYGARTIKRYIQKEIENKIAYHLVEKDDSSKYVIKLEVIDENITVLNKKIPI